MRLTPWGTCLEARSCRPARRAPVCLRRCRARQPAAVRSCSTTPRASPCRTWPCGSPARSCRMLVDDLRRAFFALSRRREAVGSSPPSSVISKRPVRVFGPRRARPACRPAHTSSARTQHAHHALKKWVVLGLLRALGSPRACEQHERFSRVGTATLPRTCTNEASWA